MANPPSCKVDGCILPVDLVLKSSDGEKIGAHKKNLEAFSEGFPPAEWVTQRPEDEIVTLTETGKILDLLMGFMHNNALPDLEEGDIITIDDLLRLYETTEKYGNFIGLRACKLAFRKRLPSMSSEEVLKVLRFKFCHSDTSDIDLFARKTANLSVKDVWVFFKGYPEVFYVWARYQIAWIEWRKEYDAAMDSGSYEVIHKDTRTCSELTNYLAVVRAGCNVPERPYDLSMADLDTTVALINKLPIGVKTICGCGGFRKWKDGITKVFRDQPKWSDFAS